MFKLLFFFNLGICCINCVMFITILVLFANKSAYVFKKCNLNKYLNHNVIIEPSTALNEAYGEVIQTLLLKLRVPITPVSAKQKRPSNIYIYM